MSAETPAVRPERVHILPNGELGIVWEDGRESYLAGHPLRCACPCATCVDEMSGRKVLQDDKVPGDVRPLKVHAVGNYGLSIEWSDGHSTGIYTFSSLREVSPAE